MLTIFSTPKPFKGHSSIIQRNALKSWKLLYPDVEVILFGDEEGAAEACSELGVRHHPHVERRPSGTKYLNYFFRRASEMAKYDLLCYANCDIVLAEDFRRAVEHLLLWRNRFLMIGRRWDTDVSGPIDFGLLDWQQQIQALALTRGTQRSRHEIDYFVFPRDLYAQIPPLVIGRICWDHFLVAKALAMRVPVVDVSSEVLAVHQNHDYSYHPGGLSGLSGDDESSQNSKLAGGFRRLRTIDDATHVLERGTIRRTYRHWRARLWREYAYVRGGLIGGTHPLRRRLGLTGQNLRRLGLIPGAK
ncbi:MAG: hypothetical protein ABSG54_15195 [Terriglobia bacterium]|jgi:hypothetical protein